MSDLIERQAAIESIRECAEAAHDNHEWDMEQGYLNAIECIEEEPSAERKHGKWDIEISHDGFQATYHCSECDHQFKWFYDPHFPPVFNYCKNCGADMRETHDTD